MFNKNDPLIGAVTGVMKENNLRRDVEKKLCEELGIYSRKVLPREHQANYDALLEQRLTEALHPNQQKLDVHEPEKDKLTKHDFKALRSGKKSKEMTEAELAAPETGPRKTSGSNQTVAEEQVDEVSKKTLGSYIKKASHDVATKSAATGRYAERSNKEEDNRKKNNDYSGYRQGRKDNETADKMFKKSWKRREGIAKATDKLTKEEVQDSSNPLPPAGAKERIQNKLGTAGAKSSVDPSYKHQGATASDREEMNKKMEKLDEVSKAKVARYATKAVDDVSHDSFIAGGASQSEKSRGTAMEFDKKAMKRQKGVNLAIKKLSGSAKVNAKEEVELDEAAKSKAQQKIMGMALAMRRGESDRGTDKVKKIATDMSDEELSKFAKTKRKGLPEKVKKMDENLTLDDVMEEIARNLGEARMKKIEEEDSNKPYKEQPLSPGEQQNARAQADAAMTPRAVPASTTDRSNNLGNSLGIKIGGRVARPGNTPPVNPERRETLVRAGQIASAVTPVGATARGVAAGTAAIQAGKNFTAGAAKGVAGSTRNVARTPTGTFTTPGGATRSGEAVGRAVTNPSVRGAVGGASAAAAGVAGISAMKNNDTSAAASTPAEPTKVSTGIGKDATDERDQAYKPTPPAPAASAPRPAAPKPAARTSMPSTGPTPPPRPTAPAAPTSKQAFQSYSDKGDDATSADFFRADNLLKKEKAMNESLANTIRKVLKG
jgi:hypothetical protein